MTPALIWRTQGLFGDYFFHFLFVCIGAPSKKNNGPNPKVSFFFWMRIRSWGPADLRSALAQILGTCLIYITSLHAVVNVRHFCTWECPGGHLCPHLLVNSSFARLMIFAMIDKIRGGGFCFSLGLQSP